jgi:N-methylhydantoinase B
MSAIEGIFQALSMATAGKLPSGGAGDTAAVQFYGQRSGTGETFYGGGLSLPVGQGAHPHSDGATLFVPSLAHSQMQSPELLEAKLPVRFEQWEFTPDSAGPGQFRGGSGWQVSYRFLEDVMLISTIERTEVPGWAQCGGLSGVPNRLEIDFADGHSETVRKVTNRKVPAGSRLRIYLGGGGGYGPPSERSAPAIRRDLLNGMTTIEHARKYYPHAL